MQALGLIETRGLLPAIACADVMLKAAQVELVAKTLVGGGLVTVVVTGDVGAVKAAVEAGAAAVGKFAGLSLVSQHIIPRPQQSIAGIVVGSVQAVESTEPATTTTAGATPAPITLSNFHKAEVDGFVQAFGLEHSVNALKSLSVPKLRNLAREYKGLDIEGRGISKANKDLLIQQLKGYYERGRNR